ncbi:MAG TPA: hypothetical protein VMH80_09850 [Bryobacteraceae bacterium]|nr:hypothetical protein [Bryobacteraceae bacterium]
MRSVWVCLLLTTASFSVSAQPLISHHGIVNAASFMQAGLPAGSIARGSLFTIFGARLGPSSSPSLSFPLSTTLGGVSVQVTQGSTTAAAIPVFVSAGQINAIMPSNAPLGAVSIYVTYNNAKSPPETAHVATDSFGIFSIDSSGIGPGVMQNFVDASHLPVNTPSAAAKPGQTIILYGTGLGAGLNADNQPPLSGDLATKVELFVGGQAATIAYSGRSSCCSGLDQINFTVPSNAPPGCWVPVQVRTSSSTVSNTTTMAISDDGSPCSDSSNALSAAFRTGKKIGLIGLLRTDVTEDVGLATPGEVTTDAAMLTFQQENPVPPAPFNAILSLPPPGTCTAYTAPGDLFDGDSIPGADDAGAKFLNAGATFTLSGTAGSRNMARPTNNVRNYQPLGYTYTGSLVPSSLILNPGGLTLSGAGGADIGSFSAPVNVSTPLTWTNRAQTTTITRSQGFTVNWTAAPSGQSVIIFGGGVDTPTNSSAVFVCVAAAGSSSFTVPSQILGNIPPMRGHLLQSKGVIYVGALPLATPASFSASGLDLGAILSGTFEGKTVIYQ